MSTCFQPWIPPAAQTVRINSGVPTLVRLAFSAAGWLSVHLHCHTPSSVLRVLRDQTSAQTCEGARHEACAVIKTPLSRGDTPEL